MKLFKTHKLTALAVSFILLLGILTTHMAAPVQADAVDLAQNLAVEQNISNSDLWRNIKKSDMTPSDQLYMVERIIEQKEQNNYPTFSQGETAEFKNVTYTLKNSSNIINLSDNMSDILSNVKLPYEVIENKPASGISPMKKLDSTVLINQSIVKAKVPEIKNGTILFDEKLGTAIKIVGGADGYGNAASGYLTAVRPQNNEVFSNITIPGQQVSLKRGNITSLSEDVDSCIIPSRDSLFGEEAHPVSETLMASVDPELGTMTFPWLTDYVMGAATGEGIRPQVQIALSDWKPFSDPLVELDFNNKTLDVPLPSGRTIAVTLDGYLGIDNITVDGEYDFMGSYRFVVDTGVALRLAASIEGNLSEEVQVPLFGLDIPAGIARVKGGIFLTIGMDGQVSLLIDTKQKLEIEAGVGGKTVLGLPVTCNPIFNPSYDMDVDTGFSGQINGYIKAGPLVGLEVFGWDIVGAAANFGAGITCSSQNNVLNGDIYGLFEIFITLLDKRVDLFNGHISLYKIRKPDTKGYDIKFMEADAYRKLIVGTIHDTKGKVTPYNGPATLRIESSQYTQPHVVTVQCDSSGRFINNLNFDLYKGDRIYISHVNGVEIGTPANLNTVGNEQADNSVDNPDNSAITPTFPFTEVVLDYADFFNDEAKGHINAARVKNWETDQYSYIYFGEDKDYSIGFTIRRTGNNGQISSIVNLNATKCSDNVGRFEYDFDFKPGDRVTASILYKGFEIKTKTTYPDTSFLGQRVYEEVERVLDIDQVNNGKESVIVKETFLVTNLRGTKSLNSTATYVGDYLLYNIKCYAVDPITGARIEGPKEIGKKTLFTPLVPNAPGSSTAEETFTTEYIWSGGKADTGASDNGSGNNTGTDRPIIRDIQLLPDSGKSEDTNNSNLSGGLTLKPNPSQTLTPTPDINSGNDTPGLTPLPGTEIKPDIGGTEIETQDPNTIAYKSDLPYTPGTGADWIRRKGRLEVIYEGAVITITDPADDDPEVSGGVGAFGANPIIKQMLDKYWSRVNPQDILNPGNISNVNEIATWARDSVISMVGRGIMDLGAGNKFIGAQNATRGECAAYMARSFSLPLGNAQAEFNDVPASYRYSKEVAAAFKNGIINGKGNGVFAPDSYLTREEAAVMIMRGLKKFYADQLNIKQSAAMTFADSAKVSAWANTAVNEVSALGLLKGSSDGCFYPQKNINMNEMAVVLERLNNLIAEMKR